LAAFTCSDEAHGWNGVVQPALLGLYGTNGSSSLVVELRSSDTLHIHLPPLPAYAAASPETIVGVIPARSDLLRSGQATVISPHLEIVPSGAAASLSTLIVGLDDAGQAVESVLRVAPRAELTITLTGDTWRPQVGNATDLAGATQALLSNIFSTQSEPYGWNAVVGPLLVWPPTDPLDPTLVRLSDTRLLVRVPTVASYDIDAPETLFVTVPREAVTGRQTVVVPETVYIRPESGEGTLSGGIFTNNSEPALQMEPVPPPDYAHGARARLFGTLLASPTEGALRAGGATLGVRLLDDLFVPTAADAAANASAYAELLLGFSADGAEAAGWNAIVRATLSAATLAVSDDRTELLATLPPYGGANTYDVRAPEVLTVALPSSSLASRRGATVVASPPLRLHADPTPIRLSGEVMPTGLDEAKLRLDTTPEQCDDPASTTPDARCLSLLSIQLDPGDGWSWPNLYDVLGDSYAPLREAFARGVRSAQSEPAGWNAVVQPALADASNWFVGTDYVAIRTPRLSSYAILAPETVEVAVPAALLLSGRGRHADPARFVVHATPGVAVVSSSLVAAPRVAYENVTETFSDCVAHADHPERCFDETLNATAPFNVTNTTQVPRYVRDVHVAAAQLRAPRAEGPALPRPVEGLAGAAGWYHTLEVTLHGDEFVAGVGGPTGDEQLSRLLLASIAADQDGVSGGEAAGWDAVIQPALTPAMLRRTSNAAVQLLLPPAAGYAIAAPETVRVALPAALLTSNATLGYAYAPLVIHPDADAETETDNGNGNGLELRVETSLAPRAGLVDETHLRSNASVEFNITLLHNVSGVRSEWPPGLADDGYVAARLALMRGVAASARGRGHPSWRTGWDALVVRGRVLDAVNGITEPILEVTHLDRFTVRIVTPNP